MFFLFGVVIVLVLFSGQKTNNLRCIIVSHLLNLGDRARGQRAGQHYNACSGHSQGSGPGVGGPGESAGDDAHGRYALGLG